MVKDTFLFLIKLPTHSEDFFGLPKAQHPLLSGPIGLHNYNEYRIWKELCYTNFEIHTSLSLCTKLTSLNVGAVIDSSSPHTKADTCLSHCYKITVQSIVGSRLKLWYTALSWRLTKYVQWAKGCWYPQLCSVKGKEFCFEGTICVMVAFLLRVYWKGGNY